MQIEKLIFDFDSAVVHISMNKTDIGVMVGVNQAACRLFHYSKEELLGQNVSIIMPEPISKYHNLMLLNYFST